jgi:hypothetical protein
MTVSCNCRDLVQLGEMRVALLVILALCVAGSTDARRFGHHARAHTGYMEEEDYRRHTFVTKSGRGHMRVKTATSEGRRRPGSSGGRGQVRHRLKASDGAGATRADGPHACANAWAGTGPSAGPDDSGGRCGPRDDACNGAYARTRAD